MDIDRLRADRLYLGVDGGGTSTEFVCIDGSGRQLASARIGTTYHLEVGQAEVVARLQTGLRAICDQLTIMPDTFASVFFGLPGFGEDRLVDPQLDQACGAMLGHARYRCGNDMVCGWAGSLGGQDGINIVAGTGSIGYGERDGHSARAGGWGEVFSDEGSAYWIAVQGLAAFTQMSDGRLEKGPLHGRIVEALSLACDLDVCQAIMGPPALSRGQVAALAPLVSAAATDGDRAAVHILHRAGQHLADIAKALRAELRFPAGDAVVVSWSGSILRELADVQSAFTAALPEEAGYRFVKPMHLPSYGAALYARKIGPVVEPGRR